MPRKYERKPGVVPREITWTERSLVLAFKELDKKEKSINEISRIYGIPSRTLRRRYKKKNKQTMTQGNYPILGFENEKKLVACVIKRGYGGYPLEGRKIRKLAYKFAEKLKLRHNFNSKTQMAGPQWLKSFLERNPAIISGQTESSPLERAKSVSDTEVIEITLEPESSCEKLQFVSVDSHSQSSSDSEPEQSCDENEPQCL